MVSHAPQANLADLCVISEQGLTGEQSAVVGLL